MKKYKLGEIADIITGPFGSQLHASDYVEKGVPSIMPKDIGDRIVIHDTIAHITEEDAIRLSKYRVNLGDIVYSRRGDIERCALITETDVGALCGTGCLRVRPDKDIVNSVFLSFYLSTPHIRKWVVDNATGATMPNLNSDILKKLPVELPDLKEQCRIANELQAIDDKINNNSKLITTLESIAKTLYDYWFVQFDFPDENGHPYKTSGGKMEWNETLSREIPAGWEVKTLFDFVELKTDSHNPQESPDSVYEHYSIPAFDKEQFPVMEKGAQINSSKYCVAKDDILYSKLNPSFKRIWSPFVFTDKAVCSTEFLVFRVKNMKGYSYIYSVINDDAFQSYMIQQSSSSTGSRKRVQPSNCMNYSFAVANDELCDKYSRVYHPIFEKRKRMIIENKKLASLRDFLLPMLMNGQVTFRKPDANGSVVIMKNNASKYVQIEYKQVEKEAVASDEEVMAVTERLMQKNMEALKVLAK